MSMCREADVKTAKLLELIKKVHIQINIYENGKQYVSFQVQESKNTTRQEPSHTQVQVPTDTHTHRCIYKKTSKHGRD